MRHVALPLVATFVLSGCVSTHVRLVASPEDAVISVDGEQKGRGEVSINVGPEYDYPKSYQVSVTRPGYAPVATTIANKPNYTAIGVGLLVNALVAYWAFSQARTSTRPMSGFYSSLGSLQLLSMPLTLFDRHQFEKQYEFKLEPDAPGAD